MKILVTGPNGFIAKNLIAHLKEREDVEVLTFSRHDDESILKIGLAEADFIFHLAGVNRPSEVGEFKTGNVDLTKLLCEFIVQNNKSVSVIFASSIQASMDNVYGESKLAAENLLLDLSLNSKVDVHIFRLPNVFGKWSRPNYNSAVATFCHNVASNLPISINVESSIISLVYIDDVIRHFISIIDGEFKNEVPTAISPEYSITVGALAKKIISFRDSRTTLITDAVGDGLTRALYSTYLSFLPPDEFIYNVPQYEDSRGVFVEMLKTVNCGQFSYFTARPGVTRGGHYHHTKTEKFLVIKGTAIFRFRNIDTNDYYELHTTGATPQIVETVPGWTHDITNLGDEDLIVMLWANEIFDREKPDTYSSPIVG